MTDQVVVDWFAGILRFGAFPLEQILTPENGEGRRHRVRRGTPVPTAQARHRFFQSGAPRIIRRQAVVIIE